MSSFWSTVARAFMGAAPPDSAPKAVLATGLGREPEGHRFPIEHLLTPTDALIERRLPLGTSSRATRRPAGAASIPSQPPRLVRPVKTHVEMLHTFILDQCTPGDILDPDEVLELYDVLCCRTGLVARPWKTVAAGLRLRMPPGPEGSDKPYHPFLQLDGSMKKRRAWYVPEAKKAKRRPRQKAAANHQSIPVQRAA